MQVCDHKPTDLSPFDTAGSNIARFRRHASLQTLFKLLLPSSIPVLDLRNPLPHFFGPGRSSILDFFLARPTASWLNGKVVNVSRQNRWAECSLQQDNCPKLVKAHRYLLDSCIDIQKMDCSNENAPVQSPTRSVAPAFSTPKPAATGTGAGDAARSLFGQVRSASKGNRLSLSPSAPQKYVFHLDFMPS